MSDARVKQVEILLNINNMDSYHYLMSTLVLKSNLIEYSDDSEIISVKPVYRVYRKSNESQQASDIHCPQNYGKYCFNTSAYGSAR